MERDPVWLSFAIASSVCAILAVFTSMDFLCPLYVWVAHEYFCLAEEGW